MALDKKIIIFDLDGTLVVSKSPIAKDMADLLCTLLAHYAVAIISGGAITQMTDQYASRIPCTNLFDHLYLLPTSGASFYKWQQNEWKEQYAYKLSDEDADKIMHALKQVRSEYNDAYFSNVPFDAQAENRGTQITFSALGQHADHTVKETWDPDRRKRIAMQAKLKALLPEFEVRIGGTTSLDINKPGINKGFGLTKFFEAEPTYTIHNALFVGDALIPGGNDYPAQEIGIESIPVKGPEETKQVIINILKDL